MHYAYSHTGDQGKKRHTHMHLLIHYLPLFLQGEFHSMACVYNIKLRVFTCTLLDYFGNAEQ